MKRIINTLLCAILIFSLASCQDVDRVREDPYEGYEQTVYVSKSSHKVHSDPNCSGMKYYFEISYNDAVKAGYDFCKNCNKD